MVLLNSCGIQWVYGTLAVNAEEKTNGTATDARFTASNSLNKEVRL
jgi:hypothetical protein